MNTTLYCSKCKAVTVGDLCPICEKRKYITEVSENDEVYLTTADFVLANAISDILSDEGIPFLKRGILGSAVTINIGEAAESYRFYVRFADYYKAADLIPKSEITDEELETFIDNLEEQ